MQACNIRDNYDAILKEDIVILGVSADDGAKHLKFIEKFDLPFTLIADVPLLVILKPISSRLSLVFPSK